MKITFIGATHQVTGSCTLLEWLPDRYALIDYGMEQGINPYKQQDLPIPASRIEYVFLTHAHIDHSGLLPLLYRNGFRGTVYATAETSNLSRIMLADSAQIQETDAAYQTKKNLRTGAPEVLPLYTQTDAENVSNLFSPCSYGKIYMVDEGLSVRFTDAGHLLGSSFVELFLEDQGCRRKVVFSGDVGNLNQPIICDPSAVSEADYLIIESTYGDREHDAKADPIPMLTEILRKTFSRGGTVIIPSFAVGRTQELLYFFREIKQRNCLPEFSGFPVYVDSPLANEATAVFLQCGLECLDEDARRVLHEGENPIWFEGLHTLTSAEESKRLNENPDYKVIIASGGMCEGGRIRHHLKHGLWNKNNTVLFAGYQAAGTLGRIIFDGAKSVKVLGEPIDVEADITLLEGISGHADRKGLLNWIDRFETKPGYIFVNHGEDGVCSEFAGTITARFSIPAKAPYSGSCYDLAAGEWVRITEPVLKDTENKEKIRKEEGSVRQARLYRELLSVADQLESRIHQMKGCSNHSLEAMINAIKKLMD
ncbi:MAG: MBL fold metallo-hydrolase [Clostridiales bacterium]|nr:MBL fold metallo-hydrolase [Clostridiales bacterium]